MGTLMCRSVPPGVHPHAEHEQKAFQRILAEMGQLAHDVHGKALGKARHPQTAQHRLQQLQHPAAGNAGNGSPIFMELEKMNADAADEGQRKQHPARQDQPRRRALCAL